MIAVARYREFWSTHWFWISISRNHIPNVKRPGETFNIWGYGHLWLHEVSPTRRHTDVIHPQFKSHNLLSSVGARLLTVAESNISAKQNEHAKNSFIIANNALAKPKLVTW